VTWLWRRFKLWYLGPEFPPGYNSYTKWQNGGGWRIPIFKERQNEIEAHNYARHVMDLVEEATGRDEQQQHHP